MDNQAALEMPSPKRVRLEVPELGANHSTQPIDHTNDVHVTPQAHIEPSGTTSQNNLKQQTKPCAVSTSEAIHLPGLSLFDNTTAASDEAPEPERVDQRLGEPDINSAIGEETIELERHVVGEAPVSIGMDEISSEKTSDSPATNSLNQTLVSAENDGRLGEIVLEDMASTKAKTQEAAAAGEAQNDGKSLQVTTRVPDNSAAQSIGDAKFPLGEEQHSEKAQVEDNVDVGQEEQVVLEKSSTLNGGSEIATFDELATRNKSEADAEFQLDSSPYESSSSSDSSSETSSSEESKDSGIDDYEMLTPEEEARRLMAEDGGADEKVTSGGPRTLNEKPEDVVPKPNVIITADMKLEELGRVENLVGNIALIKANTSGEYQVLEFGSVLCLEDRAVIGAVAETLGRVQQPYYSVRFTNPTAMSEAGVAQGTKIFYVDQFSTTVFTQPLKGLKGSDASNLHDEEVGDEELEFSDDEAEAEHKRQVKLQKRARYDAKHGQKDGFSRGPQQRPGKPNSHPREPLNSLPERPPDLANPSLNYDDGANESDDLYTPLSRPSDLHMMMTPTNGPTRNESDRGNTSTFSRGRGRGDRGEGRGRHRGNRGTGRGGNNNDRRNQRSSFENNHSHAHPAQQSVPSQPVNNLPPRPTPQGGSFHSHPQPYHPLPQPPSYPPYSSSPPHSHPNHTPQYAPPYNQPYQQHQHPQYNSDPYHQGPPQQNYYQPQSYPPQHSPITPASPAAIPPGAHINPNFFRQQAQQQPQPQNWQQQQQQQQQGQANFSQQQYQQQYQQHSPTNGTAGPPQLSPEAARRLQENLNMLRGLNGGEGTQR